MLGKLLIAQADEMKNYEKVKAFSKFLVFFVQKWDKTLCQKDSDGDGKSNGEELGDPNCIWKEGNTPERTKGLSHPGK